MTTTTEAIAATLPFAVNAVTTLWLRHHLPAPLDYRFPRPCEGDEDPVLTVCLRSSGVDAWIKSDHVVIDEITVENRRGEGLRFDHVIHDGHVIDPDTGFHVRVRFTSVVKVLAGVPA